MSFHFQVCVNCGMGQPGYPHPAECPRPKYVGKPDPDAPCARPTAPTQRTFLVSVRETRLFWDQVEVRAATPEEAEALARDEYELDWSDSSELSVTTEVLEVKP